MNRLEIRTEVENLVQDASFDDTLDSYINQCILYTGAQVDIPALKRIDTVDTVLSQAYVNLMSLYGGFSGKLRRVKNADGDAITIYANLELLMDEYPTMIEEGDVEAVALEGSTLWYHKIPSTVEVLTLLYYCDPAVPTTDSGTPSDFPAHLHRSLFVHGTAWIVFDQIEDDTEEAKVNTAAQFGLSFNESNRHSGITKLREWLAKTRRHNISSSWRT